MKFELVEQAKKYLLDKIGAAPEIAVIMGSGLSAVDEILSGPHRLHYGTIPHSPLPKPKDSRGDTSRPAPAKPAPPIPPREVPPKGRPAAPARAVAAQLLEARTPGASRVRQSRQSSNPGL